MPKSYKQTPRYRWLFYQRATSDDTDVYGEPEETITFITSGFFAYERAKLPVEVQDASETIDEVQYVLLGSYSRHYHTTITRDLFAWCPALDRLVEVLADPVDDSGNQERIVIYVVDNVKRDLDTGTLPLA